MLLHFEASKHGGMAMSDKEGVIAQAAKDTFKKVAGKITKGQIPDMSTITQPSYVHHYFTIQALHKNDLSFCTELKKAAAIKDPI